MAIERILGTDTGKVAFEKADRNFVAHEAQINNFETKVIWKALDYKTEADKPSAYPEQQTTIFVATQAWQGVANLIIRTEKYNNNIAIQYLQPNGSLVMPVMYRLAIPNTDTWGAWVQISTTESTLLASYLVNGFADNGGCHVAITGKIVNMTCVLTGGTRTANTLIATLPLKYRPTYNSYFTVISTSDNVNWAIGNILIQADGQIKLISNVTGNYLYINLSYPI